MWLWLRVPRVVQYKLKLLSLAQPIPHLEHGDAEGMVEVSVGVEYDPGVRAIDIGGGDRVELGVHPVQSVTGTL